MTCPGCDFPSDPTKEHADWCKAWPKAWSTPTQTTGFMQQVGPSRWFCIADGCTEYMMDDLTGDEPYCHHHHSLLPNVTLKSGFTPDYIRTIIQQSRKTEREHGSSQMSITTTADTVKPKVRGRIFFPLCPVCGTNAVTSWTDGHGEAGLMCQACETDFIPKDAHGTN
jgi:hypothetical protein